MRAAFELFDMETRCKVWALYLRWWVLLSWNLKIKVPAARRFWEEWERFITSEGAPLELDLCQVNPQIINLTTAELYAEEQGYSVRTRLVGIDIDRKARALRRALNPEAIDPEAPSSSSSSTPTTRAEQLAQLEPILDRVLGPCVDLDGVEQIDPHAEELELFNKICRAVDEPLDLLGAADLCWRAARRRARIGLVPDAKGCSGAFPYARQPRAKYRIEGFGTARTAWLEQVERMGIHLRGRGAVTLSELFDQVDTDTKELERLGAAQELEQLVDLVDAAPGSSSSSTPAPRSLSCASSSTAIATGAEELGGAVELEQLGNTARALVDLLLSLPQFVEYANPTDTEELARVGRRNSKTSAMMQNAITSAHRAAREHNWTGARKWERLVSFIANERGKAS